MGQNSGYYTKQLNKLQKELQAKQARLQAQQDVNEGLRWVSVLHYSGAAQTAYLHLLIHITSVASVQLLADMSIFFVSEAAMLNACMPCDDPANSRVLAAAHRVRAILLTPSGRYCCCWWWFAGTMMKVTAAAK